MHVLVNTQSAGHDSIEAPRRRPTSTEISKLNCLCAATIKPWTVWLFWIDPLAYAQRGILVNEFRDARWQVGAFP